MIYVIPHDYAHVMMWFLRGHLCEFFKTVGEKKKKAAQSIRRHQIDCM